MNIFRKSKFNFIILLIYLLTIQAGTGSILASVYFSLADEITYVKEQKPKSASKNYVFLRKHLSININEKSTNLTAFTQNLFCLPDIETFINLKIPDHRSIVTDFLYNKIKNRAPPQIS